MRDNEKEYSKHIKDLITQITNVTVCRKDETLGLGNIRCAYTVYLSHTLCDQTSLQSYLSTRNIDSNLVRLSTRREREGRKVGKL